MNLVVPRFVSFLAAILALSFGAVVRGVNKANMTESITILDVDTHGEALPIMRGIAGSPRDVAPMATGMIVVVDTVLKRSQPAEAVRLILEELDV